MKTIPNTSGVTKSVVLVLAAWLALVLTLGSLGVFVTHPGTPPLPILLGVVAPLISFLAAYRISPAFHEFVVTFDLRLAAGMQAWRFAGMEFLALYTHGVLPGFFAWPAGLGDMAVGLTAPWVILALIRSPGFAASRRFVLWNLSGILDLIIALSCGALGALFSHGTRGEISTGPMSQLPLLLIPAYLVPLFLMLHFTALIQARRAREAFQNHAGEIIPLAAAKQ